METTEIENNKKAAFCQTRRRLLFKEKNTEIFGKFACPVGFAILPAASPDLPAFLPMF
jgi:hypothetical protein